MAIARPVDRRLFFLLDRTHTQLSKLAENYLNDRSGVSPAQASVLIYLGYHDHCSLSELADGIGRNNSAITGLISRMEKAGLVARGKGGFDGRTKSVAMTEKGRNLREAVMDDFRDFNTSLVKGLSSSEVEAVLKFLSLAPENVSQA